MVACDKKGWACSCLKHPSVFFGSNAFELCGYYNICIKRNSLWVCKWEENFTETNIHFTVEEYIKLSGRLNTITIINCLTKANLKIFVSIPIFGRLIRGKIKRLHYRAFRIIIYLIRPNKNMFLCIINERTFPIYSHWQITWMLYYQWFPIFCIADGCFSIIIS